MTHLALFDDAFAGLEPVTDLRPSFNLRTGALTTADRHVAWLKQPVRALIVPPALAHLLQMHTDLPVNRIPGDSGDEPWLLVNGRWPTINAHLPNELNTAIVDPDGCVLAALLSAEEAGRFIEAGCELDDAVDVAPIEGAGLIRRPWDLLRGFDQRLRDDLARLAGGFQSFDPHAHPHVAVTGDEGIRVGAEVTIHPFVCLDASGGPIVLDKGVTVHPHSVICGPCYVGRESMLHARTDLGSSAVGPRCKLGGEISGSIIDGFSNKAHHGYLGDSYLGEWVNLGAGTTTSNLKNTYGWIRARASLLEHPMHTGMQFLGSIIADHVKTAIGTRLSTGTVIATGAMLAGSTFPPRCVGRFTFLTDAGASVADLDRFALVADRMMQRRGQRVTTELAHRLAQLYPASG